MGNDLNMDIVEFVESHTNAELKDWQKEYIRTLYKLSQNRDVRILFPKNCGRSEFYVYFNKFKELIHDGKTIDNQ